MTCGKKKNSGTRALVQKETWLLGHLLVEKGAIAD